MCDGDNSSCSDCAGVPYGDAFLDCNDDCFDGSYLSWIGDGWCDATGYSDNSVGFGINFLCEEFGLDDGDCDGYLDCAGEYFGGAELDCAGECGGSSVEDYCGVCGGDNVANECEEEEDPCIAAGGLIVSMSDSWGDGWNGNVLTIGDASFTIESGASAEGCYTGGSDVAVTCGGGSWQSEVSWTISDADGVVLSGGAPFDGCLGECPEADPCTIY